MFQNNHSGNDRGSHSFCLPIAVNQQSVPSDSKHSTAHRTQPKAGTKTKKVPEHNTPVQISDLNHNLILTGRLLNLSLQQSSFPNQTESSKSSATLFIQLPAFGRWPEGTLSPIGIYFEDQSREGQRTSVSVSLHKQGSIVRSPSRERLFFFSFCK